MRAIWCCILAVPFLLPSEASAGMTARVGLLSEIWLPTGMFIVMTMLLSLWKAWLALAVWVPSALFGAISLLHLRYLSPRRVAMGELEQAYVDHGHAAAIVLIGGPLAIFLWRLWRQRKTARASS